MIRIRSRTPRRLRAAQARALKLIPTTGRVDDLVEAVSAAQEWPVRLLPFDLGRGAPTGLWIATGTADYIVYPSGASAAERTAIICHELSHVLLQHQPVGETAQLAQMAAMVAPEIDPAVAQRMLMRHGYTQDVEAEAESFATLLVTQLARSAERHSVGTDRVSERLR